MQLVHLASRLYGTPLLIARPKLDVILSVLGPRIGLPEASAAVPFPTQRVAPTPDAVTGIAVIPVHGTLVRRVLGLEAASGLSSYGEIAARLIAAVNDPQVQGIVLDIDSPGGEAGGVFELAERIRAASALKPVWAHANDAAYSAAYAIAASASRLSLSQTAGVGSIGVIALHVDQSIKDAREGLAYTAIYAGHHKNDFSPHAPLTPQATSSLQTEVDRLYGIFVDQVAGMRAMSAKAVRATEAGLFFGDAAVEAGLADAVCGLDQVLADFAAALAVKHRLKSPSLSPNPNPGTPPKRGPQARASPISLTANSVISHPHPLQTEQTMTDPENADPRQELTQQEPTPQEPIAPSEAPNPQAPNPPTTAEAAKASASSARSEAQAIAEICLIAGAPQRTAEFLASGMTQPQVRRVLLEARAEQPEIASRITAEAGTTLRPQTSPVVAAVKKLMNKE